MCFQVDKNINSKECHQELWLTSSLGFIVVLYWFVPGDRSNQCPHGFTLVSAGPYCAGEVYSTTCYCFYAKTSIPAITNVTLNMPIWLYLRWSLFLCSLCCRWKWVWSWEPLFSCLPQHHGNLLLLLSSWPHHISWWQNLPRYEMCSQALHWFWELIVILTTYYAFDLLFVCVLDIDECSLGGNMCHGGQDCENTIGSYRCVMRCGRGFRRTADGLSCTGTSTDAANYFMAEFVICLY